MYTWEQIKSGLSDRRRLIREFNRVQYTNFRTQFNERGTDILDADWDNLLILDACRYDLFESVYQGYDLPGELERRESRAAATMEFLKANFDERPAHDTVYVTATTMPYRESVLQDNIDLNFHKIIDVWKNYLEENDKTTVPPEGMVKAGLDAAEEFPNKRLIIHFIQPHIPFIGEFGDEKFGDIEGSIWRKQRRGEIDLNDKDLWRAYEENLHEVMPAAKQLLTELEGKTAITADHGQLIGDRMFPIPLKGYGHPNGIYCDELVEVPWFVNSPENRKRIVPERTTADYSDRQSSAYDTEAEKVLRDLGYVE